MLPKTHFELARGVVEPTFSWTRRRSRLGENLSSVFFIHVSELFVVSQSVVGEMDLTGITDCRLTALDVENDGDDWQTLPVCPVHFLSCLDVVFEDMRRLQGRYRKTLMLIELLDVSDCIRGHRLSIVGTSDKTNGSNTLRQDVGVDNHCHGNESFVFGWFDECCQL